MFYSQFILAKKGPLGTIWIAAHLERKLRKNQVADTDIGVSVDSILFPEVPIALRLSSHLLLGVVRIYSRKVNYLFDDCSEALLKVKQAFRSTAVDLPPEESKAPYHSITLPETFDLDDFELPDNEVYQGNYVDHHISSREQITLQDTMEGVVYNTSQFGLDERFGDGDASQIGLDLDEELFLNKIAVKEHDGISDSVDPQVPSTSAALKDEDTYTEEVPETFETTQVPLSTVQVNECNLSSFHASDDPMEVEVEDHDLTEHETVHETVGVLKSESRNLDNCVVANNVSDWSSHEITEHEVVGILKSESGKPDDYGVANNASDLSSHNDLDFESRRSMHPEENGHLSSEQEKKDEKLEELSLTIDETMEKIRGEDTNNGVVINNESGMVFADHVDEENDPERSTLDGTAVPPSCSGLTPDLEDLSCKAPFSSTLALEPTGCSVGDQTFLKPTDNTSEVLSPSKVALDTMYQEDSPGRPEVIDAESKDFQEPKDTETQNSFVGEEIPSVEKFVLKACNSHLIRPDGLSLEGESCQATDAETQDLGRSGKPDSELSGDGQTDGRDSDKPLNCAVYNDTCTENSNIILSCDFPAPEELLSVTEDLTERPDNLPLESSMDKENMVKDDGGLSGINTISGKKRSFTESTLSVQSLNSAESVGVHRPKRITESIPDDDDLLSSILVGRRSSVFKMKPSPPVHETVSLKRPRAALRVGPSKKKVLMDDMMVLHGDTIREQLTSTEDIRRVRKKAPCTHPEILMIQRQFLEDEVFSESICSGISKELSSLHTVAFDLRKIRVYEDPVSASIEAVNNFESTIQPNVAEESTAELNPEAEINTEAVNNTEAENNTEAVNNTEAERNSELEKNTEAERNTEPEINTEAVIDSNNLESHPSHVTVQIENEDAKEMMLGCSDLDVQEQQVTLTKNLGLEPLGENTEMEIDAANGFIIDELEFPSSIMEGKYDHPDVSLQMDISCFSPDKILDSQSDNVHALAVNSGNVGLDNMEANNSTEIVNDVYTGQVNPNVSLVTSPPENGECSYLTPENGDKPSEGINVNLAWIDGEGVNTANIGCDDKDPTSVCLIDGVMDSQYSSEFGVDFKSSSFNEGANPDYPEDDMLNIVDTEIALIDQPIMEDRVDFEDATVANDIEFLNVDDDAEDDEENTQFAADASFLENSGWSSRTRAVARYLQNLFDKEAVRGRKVLHMENLLVNKTRKEASRMFFETLVLKTKDYLHVEQEKPFDNINLKARISLMKSNF